VELEVDAVLGWGDSIAIDGAAAALPKGPLLRGTIEHQEQHVLALRVDEGLIRV
jgi:hypothetical protein